MKVYGTNWEQDGRDHIAGSADCMDFFIPLKFGFDYDPGDALRFTGFARTVAGLNGSDLIEDIPEGDKNYLFEITDGVLSPLATSNLTATAVSAVNINLVWNDNSNNETGFKIERSPAGSAGWTEIHTTAANVTSYGNTGLTASTPYFYRVIAYNTAGYSQYSNTASAITHSGFYNPPEISAPSTSTGTFNVFIIYSWGADTTNQDYYELEESKTSPTSGFISIHKSDAGIHTSPYSILLTRTSGTYYYRARIYRGAPAPGFSEYSTVAKVVNTVPIQSITLINNGSSGDWLNEIVQVKVARYENGVYVRSDLLTDDPAQCLSLPGESVIHGASETFDITIGPDYSLVIGMGKWEAIFPPVGCSTATPWCKIPMTTEYPSGNYVWVWIVVNVTDAPDGNWNWTISGSYLNNTLVVKPNGEAPMTFHKTYYTPIP